MAQGVVHSTVPELPIVHLSRLVETGTWLVIGGVGRGRGGSASRPLAWGVLDVRAPCARRSSRPDAAQLAG